MYAVEQSDNTRGAVIERIEINEKSGTFFNFAAIEQNGQMVEVVVTGPDDTQSVAIYADRPHKHKRWESHRLYLPSVESDFHVHIHIIFYSFTYTHGQPNEANNVNDKPGGQLGAALVILAIIVSTIVTKRDFFLAQLTKPAKAEGENQQKTSRTKR